MPTNKYISNAGGGSGDAVGTPMGFHEAITFVNALSMPLTDDFFLNIIDDITLTAQPEALVVSGNENGRVTWQGRDAAGTTDTLRVVTSDDAQTLNYAFGSTARLGYHVIRYIESKRFLGTDGGSMSYLPNGATWCQWFRCRASSPGDTTIRRLLQVGTGANATAKGSVVQCHGRDLGWTMLDFGVHGDIDVFDCVSRGTLSHNYTFGGQYVRCLSDTNTGGDGFHRPRGGTSLTSYLARDNGIQYAEPSTGFFIDTVVSQSTGIAGIMLEGDSGLNIFAIFLRYADHSNRLRSSQADGGILADLQTSTITVDPFKDAAGLDFGPNTVGGGGALLRNTSGIAMPGGLTETYHDIGAVESECAEPLPDTTQFTGTTTDRGVN